MNIFKLSVTGHRPSKISAQLYDVNSTLSKKYINMFQNYIIQLTGQHPNTTIYCISGMALGIDTLFAIAVIKLRDKEYPVYLESAVPCINQSSQWQSESVRVFDKILASANLVTYVSDKPYTYDCMQKRNVYMVDNSDLILAVWDGTSGGTGNCVHYAKYINKPVDIVKPIYI